MAEALSLPGWQHLTSGKVRDLYQPAATLPNQDQLLVVTSDRISAYDYVLPTVIPDKGKVLTAMSVWWMEQLAHVVPNHLVSLDVPAPVAGRAMIVRRLEMFPVECVARGYLTGSGLKEYQANGQVTGIDLPSGLHDGDRLPWPIFTPATKAAVGEHDENVPFEYVAQQLGQQVATSLRDLTVELYATALGLAVERQMILADTKFEFGIDPATDQVTLADEVLTPDSSRYWDLQEYRPGSSPHSFDKQYLRDWLTKESGWDRNSPPPALPDEVVAHTRQRYIEAYQRITGQTFAA